MSASTSPRRCRLLELPGELRNRIYRMVLLEDAPIAVHDTGYDRPALVQPCKQIRTDTINIYYEENKFDVHVHNLNSDVILKWQRSLQSANGSTGTTRSVAIATVTYSYYHVIGSGRSWPNLLEHLWGFHSGELESDAKHPSDVVPDEVRTLGAGNLMATNMFCLTSTLRNEPWDVVKKTMLNSRTILSAMGHSFDDE